MKKRYAREATLGNMIIWLKALPEKHHDATCYFELPGICCLVFDGLTSYRGYYDQLAVCISPEVDNHPTPTIGEVLSTLQNAVGKIYHGHKGGEFRMGLNTPVWAVEDSPSISDYKPLWNPDAQRFQLVFSGEVEPVNYLLMEEPDDLVKKVLERCSPEEREALEEALR